VSIALVHQGRPVLGVVYAYAARAGYGDLLAWALGAPPARNGAVLTLPGAGAPAVVLLSQAADRKPAVNAHLCAPRRYRGEPSIAYRLALAAAGEGEAAVSLNSPTDWDVAAGHALLLGAGGDLYRLDGVPVVYDAQGSAAVGDCVGGTGSAPAELVRRPWVEVFQPVPRPDDSYGLLEADPARLVADPALLDRAQGCLLGQIAGDNLGAQVEFQSAAEIARAYPAGLRDLADGGQWGILAGQPTDDSELALALARSIVQNKGYEPAAALDAYLHWYGSPPFDIGGTTSAALSGARRGRTPQERLKWARQHASTSSQANGSLMRISPLGIFGAGNPPTAADWARADSRLTHPHQVCQDACAVFVAAIAAAIATGCSAQECYQAALGGAQRSSAAAPVAEALREAAERPPEDCQTHQGWVLIALQNAFYQLLHAASLEEGVVQTVMAGGDTDTNAAIAGALLGAVHGREAIPPQWLRSILSCRPLPKSGTSHPRPIEFWPVDGMRLAETLLVLGLGLQVTDPSHRLR